MKNIVLVAIILAFFTGCGQDMSLEEEWSGPWKEDVNIGITKALIKNKVTLCGEYKYKHSKKSSSEYIVHCTPDGKNWYAYIVWTGTEKIIGPHKPEIQ